MIVKHNPDQLNKRAQPQTKSFHSINEIPTKVETEKVIKEIESEAEEFEVEESLADMVDKQLKDSTGSVAKFVISLLY